jgi:hypothetical protein
VVVATPADMQGPQVEQVDPRLERRFAIFRRPRATGDALPVAAWNVLDVRDGSALEGANPALARRAIGTPAGQIYGVPARGQLCLVTSRAEAGTSSTCAEASSASEVGITVSQAAAPGSSDRLVQGMVPDGVDRVRFHGRRAVDASVHANAFQAIVPVDTREMELIGTGRRVPIVRPPQ